MSGLLIAGLGAAKLIGAAALGLAAVAGGTIIGAGVISAVADSPPGKLIGGAIKTALPGGAIKTAWETVGTAAKKAWSLAKKIPVLGHAFKGVEWGAKKLMDIPGAIWNGAKKVPGIGRLCYMMEEMVYGLKAGFNKGFLEFRSLIAKIKAKLVELLFKVLESLGKETKANGNKAISAMKKERKEASKTGKKSREAPSRGREQSVPRGVPETVKAPAKGNGTVVTADVAQKLNSIKGMAVPGGAAPVIASGKGPGQKAPGKAHGR